MAPKRQTLQKEIIRETLESLTGTHPSAGRVYEEVHAKHPTISRSTVYRVLGQIAEEGGALRVHLGGDEDRFDGNTCLHCHVRCAKCGAVADLPWTEVDPPKETGGFKLTNYIVEYSGLCPVCQGE